MVKGLRNETGKYGDTMNKNILIEYAQVEQQKSKSSLGMSRERRTSVVVKP